jgi:glyoxylase-like metal-dependent hydrolase (beta-lactamase superfamily II)
MRITERIHGIPAEVGFYTGPYPPNVYLVADGGEGALIDAGFADDDSMKARLDYLAGLEDVKLAYIVLTHHHFDHSSGAHRLREATGARIVTHRAEAPLLVEAGRVDTPQDVDLPKEAREAREVILRWREEAARAVPDRLVEDGERMRVGGATLRAVHTPGHSAGHICLFLEEERVLFSGDNVLGVGTTAIAPPPHGDMAQYVASLRKMQSLDAGLLCPGHGPVVREPNRKLQELIDHRRERDEQILTFVGQGKGSLKRLVRSVYPELDRRLVPMATGQIVSHLHKLEAEGKVRLDQRDGETHAELA